MTGNQDMTLKLFENPANLFEQFNTIVAHRSASRGKQTVTSDEENVRIWVDSIAEAD